MNFRIKWMLIGAFLVPFMMALFAVLGYLGSIYPQPIPASLITRLLQFAPLFLLPFVFGGAWVGWKLADKPPQEKVEVLLTVLTYVGSYLLIDCLWRRVGIYPDNEWGKRGINFFNSIAAIGVTLLVSLRIKSTKSQ